MFFSPKRMPFLLSIPQSLPNTMCLPPLPSCESLPLWHHCSHPHHMFFFLPMSPSHPPVTPFASICSADPPPGPLHLYYSGALHSGGSRPVFFNAACMPVRPPNTARCHCPVAIEVGYIERGRPTPLRPVLWKTRKLLGEASAAYAGKRHRSVDLHP
jgi:hypothetical protein